MKLHQDAPKRPRFGLCCFGWHFPITVDHTLFIDRVSGFEVFEGRCRCGRVWMHQSVFGVALFKCEKAPRGSQ